MLRASSKQQNLVVAATTETERAARLGLHQLKTKFENINQLLACLLNNTTGTP